MSITDWKAAAIAEANRQGVPQDIALATIEAETSGRNVPGDSGNAVGYGQVWIKWHYDSFQFAAEELGIVLPPTKDEIKAFTLANDEFSMAMSVNCIGNYWIPSKGNWDKFTRSYVGNGIPAKDYNRRLAIWNKYHNSNFDYTGTASFSVPDTGLTIPESNYQVIANSGANGDILYGRRYRVLVSAGEETALDVSELRCTFGVVKTMMLQPNYSELVIYNLSPETENALINEGNRIIIEAGYEGSQYGLIFDGNVVQPIREKENGVTYKLTLRSMDGDRFMTYGIVGFNLPRGQNSRTVIESCASQAKIPTEIGSISSGLSNAKLTRGKVVFGMAKDYLRQVAQGEKAAFYLDDGKVNIIKATDLPEGEILDLSPTSGLIGVPEQTEYGITAKSLMNPRIKLNTLIHIDNSLIRANEVNIGQYQTPFDKDGIYRVIEVKYVGDTRGNDWYAEIQTVTQAGILPGMIAGPTMNPW